MFISPFLFPPLYLPIFPLYSSHVLVSFIWSWVPALLCWHILISIYILTWWIWPTVDPFHTYPILCLRLPVWRFQTLLFLVPWYTSCTQNFRDLQFHRGLLSPFPLFFFPCILALWLYTLSPFYDHGFQHWRADISSSPSISSHDESDRPLFLSILSQFYGRGCRVGAFELYCFLFRDIHLALKTFVIYNSITISSNTLTSLKVYFPAFHPH